MVFKKKKEGVWSANIVAGGNASIYKKIRARATLGDLSYVYSKWCYTKAGADKSLREFTSVPADNYENAYMGFIETKKNAWRHSLFGTKEAAIAWLNSIYKSEIDGVV